MKLSLLRSRFVIHKRTKLGIHKTTILLLLLAITTYVVGLLNLPLWFILCFALSFYTACLIAIGIALRYNPLVKIRARLSEERKELQTSLASELSQLFGQRTYEELSTYDKAIYRDLMDYYGELQSRLIDVLLGSSISPGYRRGLIGRTSLIELLNSKVLSTENEEKR